MLLLVFNVNLNINIIVEFIILIVVLLLLLTIRTLFSPNVWKLYRLRRHAWLVPRVVGCSYNYSWHCSYNYVALFLQLLVALFLHLRYTRLTGNRDVGQLCRERERLAVRHGL